MVILCGELHSAQFYGRPSIVALRVGQQVLMRWWSFETLIPTQNILTIVCLPQNKKHCVALTTVCQVSCIIQRTKLHFDTFMLESGPNVAIKSWYMPPYIFEKSTLNLGHWSTHTESLFRLLDVDDMDQTQHPLIKRGLLSQVDWNNRARSPLEIKRACGRLELAAAKLFEFN